MRLLSNLALATLVFAAGSLWPSLSALGADPGDSHASNTVIRSVEVTAVQYREQARPVITSALLAYKAIMKLAFKVGGPVADILVEEGEAVTGGQVLARLDTEEVQARVVEAEARFNNASRTARRLAELYRQNSVSLGRLQDAEMDQNIARSQLQVAQFNLRYSAITAPVAGRVVRRSIEANELVSSGQVAFELADDTRGWVMRAALSDSHVARIDYGDRVNVRFDPWPLDTFSGQISEISEAADPHSGLFSVEITLHAMTEHGAEQKQPKRKFREGYIGRISIEPGVKERVIILPPQGLVSAMSPRGTVYVLNDDNTVSSRQIRIHAIDSKGVAVSGDLRNGEKVVTTGAAFLDENDKVHVVVSGQEG